MMNLIPLTILDAFSHIWRWITDVLPEVVGFFGFSVRRLIELGFEQFDVDVTIPDLPLISWFLDLTPLTILFVGGVTIYIVLPLLTKIKSLF